MTKTGPGRPPLRGSYGVDAPIAFVLYGSVIAMCIVTAALTRSMRPLISATVALLFMADFLYVTRRGKFVEWDRLLEGLALSGDERVLDLGCGRGAVLLLVARRLKTGRAVGADLWQKKDQSGNSPEATLENAAAEGVQDRVDVHTADMTALPFDDQSFDVIVSSLAIHNIPTWAGRDRAIEEAVRVLRPAGRILIADIRATRRYARRLRELGMADVSRRRLGWRMWWSGPWAPTRLVTARKPAA